MKGKYKMLLSMMILDLKQPKTDIDVYLSLLIGDLRVLMDEGVDVVDTYSGETFKTCHVILHNQCRSYIR